MDKDPEITELLKFTTYKSPIQNHETSTINIQGIDVLVDTSIMDLIKLLNNIPGVVTCFSCESSADKSGYVSITGYNADLFMMLWLKQSSWVKAESHNFVNGWIIRWPKSKYFYALDAAKNAEKKLISLEKKH